MNAVAFDKLAYVDRFTQSGVSEKQARAQADALNAALHETIATKADIARLDARIEAESAAIRGEMKADIAGLGTKIEAIRGEMKTESAAIRGEMKAESARLERKIEAESAGLDIKIEAIRGELRLVKWMLALVILGVVIPLIRDLHGLYDKLP